jgi:carboxypeptidase PM20D1
MIRALKKLTIFFSSVLLLVTGIALARTARYTYTFGSVERAIETGIPGSAAERLAGAIRIPTISPEEPGDFDAQAFRNLHRYLANAFPRVHSELQREIVGEHSLLYTWRGANPVLKPILLMGHLDVVPVERGTEAEWQEDPFSGRIAAGYIWGRGAIDNKSAVLGTLEAVEMLLGEGYQPTRTVYLAYGHDEEIGGSEGARQTASLLRNRGIELEMVLDEGGVIGEGVIAGISVPVALVGVAEKGFASIELSTHTEGGHSSLPPQESAIGILSAAVARLEASAMPPRFDGATRQLFEQIGPLFPIPQRVMFANLWLTRPLVVRSLAGRPTTNAMVRTTTAPTIFQSGTKDNVLPTYARAVVNFRILPGDSVAGLVEHVRRVIDDTRIEVKTVGRFSSEPSEVSGTDSTSFRTLERTIRKIAPDAIVAPYLVVVVTDARYYSDLTSNTFRFLPIRLTSEDLKRMHGIDERLAVLQYETAIRVYRQLILDSTTDSASQ